MLLGAIADDVTGGTDLASSFRQAGMRVLQTIGLPDHATPPADAIVVSLKTRTVAPGEAVAASLAAARFLRERHAPQLYFKYCSTFDSTDAGNIGPVADALLETLCEPFTIACPAFPTNKRTVYEGHLFVGTKIDLQQHANRGPYDLTISSETGAGLDQLRTQISDRLKVRLHPHSLAIPTRARHRDSLAECLAALNAAVSGQDAPLDLRAEELRLASTALGRITGRVDVENLLDVIFSEFCIGK